MCPHHMLHSLAGFDHSSSPAGQKFLLPFYGLGNRCSKTLSNLSRVTWLVNERDFVLKFSTESFYVTITAFDSF